MTPKQKRTEIKRILPKLSDGNRHIFMRMYSPHDLDKDINLVVDKMPAKQLNWALQQTQNTYYSIFRILKKL
jgi:hypothetical protein